MVRRYNAEGNRRTATPELLRCNAKVIRRQVTLEPQASVSPGRWTLRKSDSSGVGRLRALVVCGRWSFAGVGRLRALVVCGRWSFAGVGRLRASVVCGRRSFAGVGRLRASVVCGRRSFAGVGRLRASVVCGRRSFAGVGRLRASVVCGRRSFAGVGRFGRRSFRASVVSGVGRFGRRSFRASDFGAWVIKAPDSALLLRNDLRTLPDTYRDRSYSGATSGYPSGWGRSRTTSGNL